MEAKNCFPRRLRGGSPWCETLSEEKVTAFADSMSAVAFGKVWLWRWGQQAEKDERCCEGQEEVRFADVDCSLPPQVSRRVRWEEIFNLGDKEKESRRNGKARETSVLKTHKGLRGKELADLSFGRKRRCFSFWGGVPLVETEKSEVFKPPSKSVTKSILKDRNK